MFYDLLESFRKNLKCSRIFNCKKILQNIPKFSRIYIWQNDFIKINNIFPKALNVPIACCNGATWPATIGACVPMVPEPLVAVPKRNFEPVPISPLAMSVRSHRCVQCVRQAQNYQQNRPSHRRPPLCRLTANGRATTKPQHRDHVGWDQSLRPYHCWWFCVCWPPFICTHTMDNALSI